MYGLQLLEMAHVAEQEHMRAAMMRAARRQARRESRRQRRLGRGGNATRSDSAASASERA
jgi:hypothetical protein